jgi:hypothetical protein
LLTEALNYRLLPLLTERWLFADGYPARAS